MAVVVAMNNVFTRESPVISDESQLAPFIEDDAGQPMSNDAINSAETARDITQRRVRLLWDITETARDFAAPVISRYTLWLLNASSQECKQWREIIAQTLYSELYPTLALSYFFRNAISNGAGDGERFKWTTNVLGSLINFTDCSRDFRKSMLENGAVEDLLQFLSESLAWKREAAMNKNYEEIMRYIMIILLNMAKMSSAKQAFNRNGGPAILSKYLDYEGNPFFNAAAALCIARVVDDDDKTMKLLEDNGIISLLRYCYEQGMALPSRMYCPSISCQEIADGFKNLVASDLLKDKLMQLGLLGVAVDLMEKQRTHVEQYYGVDIVWSMCFGKNNLTRCQIIVASKGCMNGLKHLVDNPESAVDVRELARRTLTFFSDWEKKFAANIANKRADQKNIIDPNNKQIFISYSWKYQPLVDRIRELLEANHFVVWMDVNNSGPTALQEMAQAIERAAIVIVAYSESYRRSPSCRTEAEYAWALNKKILTVRVEKNYVPDGWLGVMVQARPHIDGTEEIDSLWMDKVGSELFTRVNRLMLESNPPEPEPGALTKTANKTSSSSSSSSAQGGSNDAQKCSIQ